MRYFNFSGLFISKAGKYVVNKYFEMFFHVDHEAFCQFWKQFFFGRVRFGLPWFYESVCVFKGTSYGYIQKVLNDLYRTRLSLHRMIWLLPHPLPPFPSVNLTGGTKED
jgi:hypothetical protein